jgi:hypothetical protein
VPLPTEEEVALNVWVWFAEIPPVVKLWACEPAEDVLTLALPTASAAKVPPPAELFMFVSWVWPGSVEVVPLWT